MFKFRNIILLVGALGVAISVSAATNQSLPVNNNSAQITSVHHKKLKIVAVVNINTVDEGKLQKVKFVGKSKAKKIIEYRNQHGVFKSVDELLNVKCRGINQKWLERVKKYITV